VFQLSNGLSVLAKRILVITVAVAGAMIATVWFAILRLRLRRRATPPR